jgi:hypothetical protein
LNYLDIFSKNTQISNFIKIRPVGTELFHADGQTNTDRNEKGSSSFSKFYERVQKTQKTWQSVEVALTAKGMEQNNTNRNNTQILSKFGKV